MYTAEIEFRLSAKVNGESVAECVNALIVALQRNGQILSDEWPIAVHRNTVRTFVSIPERGALKRTNANEWTRKARRELKNGGVSRPVHRVLGREPDTLNVCACKEPSAYILYTDFLSMESPLRCADCSNPVPLYRIPHTAECGTYEDIIFWRRDYQSCDGLQMSCTVGERFCTRQMSAFDSELSRQGLECCNRVAEVTGKSCYYYLYRYYGRGKAREAQRRCPSCGGEWRLKEKWHGRFDFRCDRCHLTSNFAYSVY